jgi:predicted phosphodiesterase
MVFLCLSDIHGHLDALTAVLATAEKRNFQKLLVAGDLVFPGPEPLEVWKRLQAAGAVLVQGVTDKALATLDPERMNPTTEREQRLVERMKETRTELGELILNRLKKLPTHARLPLEDGGELLLVHGSPSDPAEALSHDMSDEEINALIGDDPADVIVCGMSHVPFDRMVGDIRVINVGSIGEAPDGQASVEAGRPSSYAHATWIESTPSGLLVEQITVPTGKSETRLVAHG